MNTSFIVLHQRFSRAICGLLDSSATRKVDPELLGLGCTVRSSNLSGVGLRYRPEPITQSEEYIVVRMLSCEGRVDRRPLRFF